jgi:hypothetical protein
MVESSTSIEEKVKNQCFSEDALYLLYLSKERINSENLKLLKYILCYIIKNIKRNLTIEIYFDPDVDINLNFIINLLWNGYNLVKYIIFNTYIIV